MGFQTTAAFPSSVKIDIEEFVKNTVAVKVFHEKLLRDEYVEDDEGVEEILHLYRDAFLKMEFYKGGKFVASIDKEGYVTVRTCEEYILYSGSCWLTICRKSFGLRVCWDTSS